MNRHKNGKLTFERTRLLIEQLAVVDLMPAAEVADTACIPRPFRVNKRQFGHVKVRSRGLAKNTV